jgi:hypothetical protein
MQSGERGRRVALKEANLDFGTLLGYLETLALLYAWTFVAAGAFAVGEMIFGGGRALRGEPGSDASGGRPAS